MSGSTWDASRCWRICGTWPDGRMFLIVMGTSPQDCGARLRDATSNYTVAELRSIKVSLWHWRFGRWYEVDLILDTALRKKMIGSRAKREAAEIPAEPLADAAQAG